MRVRRDDEGSLTKADEEEKAWGSWYLYVWESQPLVSDLRHSASCA
jgi:hypothetical protein